MLAVSDFNAGWAGEQLSPMMKVSSYAFSLSIRQLFGNVKRAFHLVNSDEMDEVDDEENVRRANKGDLEERNEDDDEEDDEGSSFGSFFLHA